MSQCDASVRFLNFCCEEIGDISKIDSLSGDGNSFYNFLVYWVSIGLNSVDFFNCPSIMSIRENLWIGIIVIIGLFFLVPFIAKK
tara:strand:+ start:227 stop:481 length:255 start_codon:yes stop_codon:yes gene_type:complete